MFCRRDCYQEVFCWIWTDQFINSGYIKNISFIFELTDLKLYFSIIPQFSEEYQNFRAAKNIIWKDPWRRLLGPGPELLAYSDSDPLQVIFFSSTKFAGHGAITYDKTAERIFEISSVVFDISTFIYYIFC